MVAAVLLASLAATPHAHEQPRPKIAISLEVRSEGRPEPDAAASDEVVIESIDPLKPAVMKATDSGDFLYLLMPVRIA